MRFVPEHPLEGLRAAEYNPRRITPEGLQRLRESIARLGFCKNIVALEDGLLLAGHQRTQVAKALGLTGVPAYIIPKLAETKDEVRFNQLHNGTDTDVEGLDVQVPPGSPGWAEVPASLIRGNMRAKGAVVREEIANLMVVYGGFGNTVARADTGEVVSNGHYAMACKLLGRPCRVCYLTPSQAEHVGYLHTVYGEFSYEHLPLCTWNQTRAQTFRLRNDRNGGSRLYDNFVVPWLSQHPTARVLDFGCGQGDYLRALLAKGYRMLGLEFFARKGDALDPRGASVMVEAVLHALEREGQWDAVVADGVLNSTDRVEAGEAVLDTLRALCKPGGRLFFGGRSVERAMNLYGMTKFGTATRQNYISFPDKHNFTGTFHHGEWFYQRFHTAQDVAAMIARVGDPHALRRTRTTWQVSAANLAPISDADAERALRYEFGLPLPGGRCFPYAEAAVRAYHAAKGLRRPLETPCSTP